MAFYDVKVRYLHADNQFRNKTFLKFANSEGLKVTFSTPHNSKSNSIAERTIQTMSSAIRTMMKHTKMKSDDWFWSARQFANIWNRSTY